ncbi:MAG: hypothetical protein LBS68_03570 [Puniceicoccales bacterium]|jgi:type III secretion system needle length determinant|nr:hypothetical protein [Puniceicoccales bacterium]
MGDHSVNSGISGKTENFRGGEGGTESKRSSQPKADDVQNFRAALGRPHGELSATKRPESGIPVAFSKENKKNLAEEDIEVPVFLEETPPPGPAAAMFVPFGVEPPKAAAPTATRVSQNFVQLATKMVNQILINDAAINKKAEIHINLKDSVLAGSQVQISRDGGTLKVAFLTPNGQMADLIQQNQGTLRNTLMNRLQLDEVDIQTQEQGRATENGGGGSGGRSRGQRDAREEYGRREQEEDR